MTRCVLVGTFPRRTLGCFIKRISAPGRCGDFPVPRLGEGGGWGASDLHLSGHLIYKQIVSIYTKFQITNLLVKQLSTMVSKKPVALVVGASRGIGRQVAVDLARNGYAGMSSFSVFIVLMKLTL